MNLCTGDTLVNKIRQDPCPHLVYDFQVTLEGVERRMGKTEEGESNIM